MLLMLPVICAALSFGTAVPFVTILEKGTKNAVLPDAKGYLQY